LSRIDGSGRLLATFRPEAGASGRLPLAAGHGQLWVASQDGSLTRLDPRSGRAIRTFRDIGYAESLGVGDNAIWIGAATADVVERFDPRTGKIGPRIQVGGRPSEIAVGDGAVWVLTPVEERLWRIDPRRNAVVASVAVPSQTTSVTTVPGGVWIGSQGGLVAMVDAASNRILPGSTKALGHRVDGLASGDGRLWATVG
jgi:streptogramin lyase